MKKKESKRGLLFCIFIASIYFQFPVLAQEQDISSDLSGDEAFLQKKLTEYSHNYTADTAPSAIPDSLFTLMALRAILADQVLQESIDEQDLAAIAAWSAPVDQRFIVQDHDELRVICERVTVAEDTEVIQELARRFDEAKEKKQQALNTYYSQALASLSLPTQQAIKDLRSELSVARHLTYTVFDLSGFAQELPGAAKMILSHGCASFAQRLATYTPEVVTLRDQVPRS